MNSRIIWIVGITGILILLDIYVFQAVKTVTQGLPSGTRKICYAIFWGLMGSTYVGILLLMLLGFEVISTQARNFFLTWIFAISFAKIFISLFLLIDDLQRLVRFIAHYFQKSEPASGTENIPRAEFLSRAGLIAGAIPLLTFSYGIIKGAHDYKIRRHRIGLKNLPPAFNGLKIAQLSDIHSGSFFDKDGVERGIQMLLDEKPDIVFFTGDLVNNIADEMKEYVDVFSKVKAPMGVYSTLGNHDYGDYVQWASKEEKAKNLNSLLNTHKEMGWDILMNENRILERKGEKIAVLGVENWSARTNFPKYGKMHKAYKGTENIPVKLLLSHDPTHWRAQVLQEYGDIDVTFSGHTHGFQFGIEAGKLRWSPAQWVYKEWAGLYQEKEQYLYVNRGFGYIGFPGRVGIYPEITIVELYKA